MHRREEAWKAGRGDVGLQRFIIVGVRRYVSELFFDFSGFFLLVVEDQDRASCLYGNAEASCSCVVIWIPYTPNIA